MIKQITAFVMLISAILGVAGIPLSIITFNGQLCLLSVLVLVTWYFVARGLVFLYGGEICLK